MYIIESQDGSISEEWEVTVNFTLSITENVIDLDFYPNPAIDYLNLENFVGYELSIYSSLGRLCEHSKELDNRTFYVGSLEQGVYFVKLVNKDKIFCKKLIISK